MNKFIPFGLIKPQHNKLVFFFALLISLTANKLLSQVVQKDTLINVSADSLRQTEDTDNLLENPIIYNATDSAVFLSEKKQVFLYGKAHVEFGNTNLDAEFIEIDYSKNLVTAYGKLDSLGKKAGNPVFKDGEQEMSADKIIYNLKTKKGKIFNALTKQGELLVIGEEIKKDSTNVIYMKGMKCIPCQQEDARTIFKATKAKIIPDDKIVTGPMYLEIGGAPTPLGLPFGFFPNSKRQHNGVLIPTFGNSTTQGFNLRNGGYYWGINDKTDMIVRGDVYGNGSWALNTTNNYNVLYKANGYTYIGYSQFNIGDKDIPTTYSKQKAYEVRWTHNQDNKSNPTIRFGANVNYVKNQSYNRINAINSGQFLQNSFQSNINFTKSYKLSSLSLNATHSQNSISKQVDITFPALTFNINRFYPFRREGAIKQNALDKVGINYLLEARNSLTGKDSTIFMGNVLDSLKYGIKHSLPISTNFNMFKYITVTPAINLSSVMYTKSIQKYFSIDDTVVGKVYTKQVNDFVTGYDANFSTALNTKVFFDYYFKGKVKQIRHLLIPTISYLYRPDFGEEQYGFWKKVQVDTFGTKRNYSIFEKNIFGGPAIGEQNAVSINLNNNIEAKLKQKTDTGFIYNKKTLMQNISLGTSYNFAADSFNMSLINITARTKVFKYFDVVANSNFDPYAYDASQKRVVNNFSYNTDGRLARLTLANIAVNTAFGSNMIEAARKSRQAPNMTNGAEQGAKNDLNKAEKLPWNLNIYYNLSLANYDDRKLQPTQTLNFSGDLMPTKYWKIGVTSGYDFTNQKASYTSINIYRDLKCWEARIDWVPFGLRKSYSLTINLKASMLSDFKIPKRSPPIDNF
ncbi:putative LPS assembly protein LptD [Sediminibacterium sp.]|uniref:putative LPS assembly protein LptD n=1 Tax=Sediminibacterium sp. TaxID=1917865 RepID=UPI002734342D|nr:putative LPS assembly protein LptD [Sediminibacterium sp.]